MQPGQDREPDRWIARPRGDSSSRRHFVECERETRRAIAAGERDMLAQHTDESFRADHVRFRNAGGAVVQVLMRSDFFATEAFFCDHGRHPFLEQRRGPGGLRMMAPRITSPPRQGVQAFSARISVMWLSPTALKAMASGQRSISPNTMSSEPMIAATSASICPRLKKSIACKCANDGARILHL